MRASSVGINALRAIVLENAFLTGQSEVVIDFEVIHFIFHLRRLDVQLGVVLVSVTRTQL